MEVAVAPEMSMVFERCSQCRKMRNIRPFILVLAH